MGCKSNTDKFIQKFLLLDDDIAKICISQLKLVNRQFFLFISHYYSPDLCTELKYNAL